MFNNLISLFVLLSPAVFVATAIASWFQPGLRPGLVRKLSTVATFTGIIIGGLSAVFVYNFGLIESGLIGIEGFGFSIRLDPVSVIMLNLIALLSFIIIKFSKNYLDGDGRQGIFMGRMAAAVASVQLLVLSANLGLLLLSWILTSISLHRLLVFYRERPGAIFAAKKKFILARLGDLCLLVATILLYRTFGSGNLEVIFSGLSSSTANGAEFIGVEGAALFLVLAALLKSAQFPTHGWLVEVMETPTPVSALLHAGLLNAGPFLIIRMAQVMEVSSIATIILIAIGGFTAVFGSVVYLTQTSVKTALGYSSVAHMGFSLMVCGLGLYSAAMLHLLAHSFYKAHSFLSSGSVIDVMKSSRIKGLSRNGDPLKITLGVIMALGLYTGFLALWGIDLQKDLSLLIIGGVIVLGLSRLFSSALDTHKNSLLLINASFLAILVVAAFFSLEAGTEHLLSSQLPERFNPGWGELLAVGIVFLVFSLVVFLQIVPTRFSRGKFGTALAIHLRNGLYANAIFDRVVGALNTPSIKVEKVALEEEIESQAARREERFLNQKGNYGKLIQLHSNNLDQRSF